MIVMMMVLFFVVSSFGLILLFFILLLVCLLSSCIDPLYFCVLFLLAVDICANHIDNIQMQNEAILAQKNDLMKLQVCVQYVSYFLLFDIFHIDLIWFVFVLFYDMDDIMNRNQFMFEARQIRLISELQEIYPIERASNGEYTIRGLELNELSAQQRDDEVPASALGYLVHMLILLSKYLEVRRYYYYYYFVCFIKTLELTI